MGLMDNHNLRFLMGYALKELGGGGTKSKSDFCSELQAIAHWVEPLRVKRRPAGTDCSHNLSSNGKAASNPLMHSRAGYGPQQACLYSVGDVMNRMMWRDHVLVEFVDLAAYSMIMSIVVPPHSCSIQRRQKCERLLHPCPCPHVHFPPLNRLFRGCNVDIHSQRKSSYNNAKSRTWYMLCDVERETR